MKKLTEFWIGGKLQTRLQRRNMLRVRQKMKLTNLIMQLRKCIPFEFQRKPRDIKYITQWKATEYRFFLLYCGPIVFRGVLNPLLYKHFLLFHVACRILYNNDYAFVYTEYAKIYLTKFFKAMGYIYGRQSQIMNAHNLIHLPDDVQNLNCTLTNISAFPFESILGRIKLLIRNSNRPLAQVCRRLHEMSLISKKVSIPPTIEILKMKRSENENRINIIKIKYKGFILTTKFPNNLVILRNGVLLIINKMTCSRRNSQHVQIEGNQWKVKQSIFKYPTKSEDLKMWELTNSPSRQITQIDINQIQQKMLHLKIISQPCRKTCNYAIALLHD